MDSKSIRKRVSIVEIHSDNIFTAKEIKERLELKGEIDSITLYEGRSPQDIEQGLSSDDDRWSIKTIEKLK